MNSYPKEKKQSTTKDYLLDIDIMMQRKIEPLFPLALDLATQALHIPR